MVPGMSMCFCRNSGMAPSRCRRQVGRATNGWLGRKGGWVGTR